jgi:hypothetical protein
VKIRVEGSIVDIQRVLEKLKGETVEVLVENNTASMRSQTWVPKKAKTSIRSMVLSAADLERRRQRDRDRKRKERATPQTTTLNRRGLNAHGLPLKGGPSSYWGKMSPQQRKEEMAHRAAVRSGKAQPRPRHYDKANFPMGGVA